MDVPGSRTDVERYRRLDEAFRTGDMIALHRELGSNECFPNVVAHPAMGACLTYAIYHSPLTFVGELLEAGADPDEITRIDDLETPLEVATTGGHRLIMDRLRPLTTRPE